MNYDEYRTWRDQSVAATHPLRLDCMNPAKALDFMVAAPVNPVLAPVSVSCRFFDDVPPAGLQQVAGQGVRKLLAAVFDTLRDKGGTLFLPEDVYPVYFELAAGLPVKSFATLTGVDWSFLIGSGPDDAVLVPAPLSPAGLSFTAADIDALQQWLAGSKQRLLILDTVYTFDEKMDKALIPLLQTGQVAALYSLSKSYLLPRSYGIGLVPAGMALSTPEPLSEDLPFAHHALTATAQLPAQQQALFNLEWERLSPVIRAVDPGWQPPTTGYFSVIRKNARDLLREKNILAVPATVFGSGRDDLSVITCLYDMRLHYAAGKDIPKTARG